jgi:hypothetical protein
MVEVPTSAARRRVLDAPGCHRLGWWLAERGLRLIPSGVQG